MPRAPAGAMGSACRYYLANPSSDYSLDGGGAVPAGATVAFYAFYAPPAAGVATVDMELGGFGETVPTPVPH